MAVNAQYGLRVSNNQIPSRGLKHYVAPRLEPATPAVSNNQIPSRGTRDRLSKSAFCQSAKILKSQLVKM
ncbi:hypothetical protein ACEYW6_36710, partial [Nostoc sp. UIC 10607]|uniref:hypothetical protein n=1 Tax=Nostoc sp. UIC 10607 TaxID=3045935 RepID=UPI0039A07529